MTNIIALRPIEFEVSCDDCVEVLTGAMMAPVFAFAERMKRQVMAEGMPGFRVVRVTVRASEALTNALLAEDAFDLILEYDK